MRRLRDGVIRLENSYGGGSTESEGLVESTEGQCVAAAATVGCETHEGRSQTMGRTRQSLFKCVRPFFFYRLEHMLILKTTND